MITPLLAFLLLAAVQETPDALVRKLGDDTIEGREAAAEKLLRIGEPARKALQEALKSGDVELRLRADRILKILDIQKEIRAWLAPATRITISGERTLQESAKQFERQTGHKIEGEPWPEGRFRVEVKDATYWDALEAVCAASGLRTPEMTETGIKLSGIKFVRKPRVDRGAFTVRIDSIERGREFDFNDRTEKRYLAITVVVGWERSIVPVGSYVEVEKAADDQGLDLKPGFEAFDRSGSAGGAFSAEEPPAKYSEKHYFVTYDPPKDKARVIPELSGKVVIWVKASPEYISLPCPEAALEVQEHPTDSVAVFDDKFIPAGEVKVTMAEMGSNCSRLRIEGVDPRILKKNSSLAYMTDKEGQHYPTVVGLEPNEKGLFDISFTEMPDDAKPDRITLRIPRRVVKLEIPFTLKDIPIK